jgi:hypothetical protein
MKSFDSVQHLKLTYGELAAALKQLGFQDQSTSNECVFFNKKHEILFKLAKKTPEAEVFHLDLMGITFHLVWKNVITEREDLWKVVEAQKRASVSS